MALAEHLGIPLAPDKTMGPSHDMIFLGIKLDSTNMLASLPTEKLVAYKHDLLAVLDENKITLRDLKS